MKLGRRQLCLVGLSALLAVSVLSPTQAHILNSDTWSAQINADAGRLPITSDLLCEDGQMVFLKPAEHEIEEYEIPISVRASGIDKYRCVDCEFLVVAENEEDRLAGAHFSSEFLSLSGGEEGQTTLFLSVKSTVSTEMPPAEEILAEETSAEETPAERILADEMPAEEIPAEEILAEETSAEEIPAERILADEMPARETPVAEAYEKAVSAQEPPVAEEPTEETPPAEEPPAEEPTEETPTAEEPTEETPTAEEPTGNRDLLLAVTLYCDGEPLLSATLCVPAERRTDTAVNTGASKFKAIYHPETPFLLYIDADTQISFSTECSPAEEPFPAMTRYTVFSEKEAVRGLLFEPGYIPVKEGESVEIDLSQTELVQQCADIRVNCGSYCMILYYAQHPDAEQMTFPVLVGEEGKELPVRYCWGGIEPACAVTRLSADTRKWEDYGRFDFLCTDTGKIGVYPMGAKAGSYRAIVVWQETIAGKYYSEYSVDFPFFVQYRYASEGIW